MPVELEKGQVELKRVLDADLGRRVETVTTSNGETIETEVRDFPMEPGQTWVYDRNGDTLDKTPEKHEWVLIGPGKSK